MFSRTTLQAGLTVFGALRNTVKKGKYHVPTFVYVPREVKPGV